MDMKLMPNRFVIARGQLKVRQWVDNSLSLYTMHGSHQINSLTAPHITLRTIQLPISVSSLPINLKFAFEGDIPTSLLLVVWVRRGSA